MTTLIGIAVIILGLIAWVGQSISFIAPGIATKFGLLEPKGEMDETLHVIEAKALGLNDMLLTWTFPLSGALLLLGHPLWPYFGLVGGGIFFYFSGLIFSSRFFLKRAGKKIGSTSGVTAAYTFSALWAIASISMIILSITNLAES